MHGDFPGIAPAPLTAEPLGTQGELSPGPDSLDPSYPDERRELIERGYLKTTEDDVSTVGGVREADEYVPEEPLFEPLGSSFDDPPELPPLF